MIKEKEYCENCNKEITDKMKDNQQVIYSSAEHTLSAPSEGQIIEFNDPMFNGPFCCHECFDEVIGINIAKKLGKEAAIKEEIEFLEKNEDRWCRELFNERLSQLKADLEKK